MSQFNFIPKREQGVNPFGISDLRRKELTHSLAEITALVAIARLPLIIAIEQATSLAETFEEAIFLTTAITAAHVGINGHADKTLGGQFEIAKKTADGVREEIIKEKPEFSELLNWNKDNE
jgi:hypothetical protein